MSTAARHSRAEQVRTIGTLHRLSIVGRIFAALLSILLFAAFGYGWYNYRDLDGGFHRLALSNLGGSTPTGTNASSAGQQVSGRTQNILIVGIDSRDGLSAAERRLLKVGNADTLSTDSMMIVHVPADGSRATLVSLPRDSYVDIPGYAKNKLNAAFADAYSDAQGSTRDKTKAGADLLIETVHLLTGLPIDHYVQVSFAGFYTITKAIGKISVNLCHDVDDTVAHNRATGEGGGSGFTMTAGRHDLDAVQALEFVRQRHNLNGGDLARVKRQRYFLAAAFNRIASAGVLLNPGKLHNLITAIHGAFYVDGGFSLPGLAGQMTALNGKNIIGQTIPTGGTVTEPIAGSVTLVDPVKVRAFVDNIVNPPAKPAAGPASATPESAPGSGVSTGTSTGSAPPNNGCIN